MYTSPIAKMGQDHNKFVIIEITLTIYPHSDWHSKSCLPVMKWIKGMLPKIRKTKRQSLTVYHHSQITFNCTKEYLILKYGSLATYCLPEKHTQNDFPLLITSWLMWQMPKLLINTSEYFNPRNNSQANVNNTKITQRSWRLGPQLS